jgi:catechol 2,3-dioxygenase-like lactoylglutathione lyase family enzyme/WD40 repeat protein
MTTVLRGCALLELVLLAGGIAAAAAPASLGLFENQSDVGSVVPAGSGTFDAASGIYTLTSAGANTWYHVDGFHYLWNKVSGDMVLTADVSFPPRTYAHDPNPHRKGILMFRQSLDAGAAYAAVGVHGSGLTALQFRRERGANTEDVELNIDAPKTVRIEKRGATFTLLLSMRGEPLHPVGASVVLPFKEPFYAGLGALSHDVNTVDSIEFSHVTLERPASAGAAAPKPVWYSTVQTIQTEDQYRRAMVIRSAPDSIQSVNWSPDGQAIYVYEAGHVVKIPYFPPGTGGAPLEVDTGGLVDCSGNFGLSPDGRWLAMSCAESRGGPRAVYVLPAGGIPKPRKITTGTASSFFHAWSPDSGSIAFTRGSADRADIFTIATAGGTERQLTRDTINDGPDYSPDGKFIYFDSARSGTTQIWRMNPDGSAAEQVTDDANLNSSPHVSPDGKTIAFLSRPAGSGASVGEAALKVMSTGDGLIRTLATFQGNRGSLSTYGWGDSNHLAFVSYQASTEDSRSGESKRRPPIVGVSHIALYASDPVQSERFYVHDLGALKGDDPENSKGVRYYFAPTQFVEVLPLPGGAVSMNRLDHVAFATTDAEALRRYLAKSMVVPKRVERGQDTSLWFDVTDPEGNKVEFVQPPGNPPRVPVNAFSSHIIHVGFIVHDRNLEDDFFRTLLGFRPYWSGGMKDATPTWISLQVPDGTDWLEYMIVGKPGGRGIPPDMSAADLGVLDHFSLGVPSAAAAYALLWNGDRLAGQQNTPKIGRDAKWQLNLLDPDGTRAEVMEFHAIGTPCCSPFTASDPQN